MLNTEKYRKRGKHAILPNRPLSKTNVCGIRGVRAIFSPSWLNVAVERIVFEEKRTLRVKRM